MTDSKRRGRFEQRMDVLESIQPGLKGIYWVMRKSNIDWRRLKREELPALIRAGLVREIRQSEHRRFYELTPRGMDLLGVMLAGREEMMG